MKKWNIWVVGGDRRQRELAHLFALDGHSIHTFAFEERVPGTQTEPSLFAIGQADLVILPLPVCRQSDLLNAPFSPSPIPIESVLDALSPQQLLFGGMVSRELQASASRRRLFLHDYFTREELTIANAVPTAEGALQLAMEHLPITVHGARILILGFGHVGQATARCFHALNAQVTAAARSPHQLSLARAMGVAPLPLSHLSEALPHCDLVINTIPAPVLWEDTLSALPPECPILELASPPGGTDPEAVSKLHRTLIPAPGLPGKVAPVTAALAIQTTIYNMLHELGQ